MKISPRHLLAFPISGKKDNKQREALLESFDLDVNELNKEQGISHNEDEPQVIIGQETFAYGRKNVLVDFNFDKNNLMAFNYTKPTLKEKSFLFGTIFIGVFINLFSSCLSEKL